MGVKKKLFWLVDMLKGNPLKKDLEDITQCLECNTFSELKSHTEPKLNALLHEAIEYTCYYKKYKGYSSFIRFSGYQ